MSDRSLLRQRYRLPLPKPINGSFSSFKYNESPINNYIPNPQISQPPSLDVIPCQQTTLNLYPAGKTMPNRRGRKPLSTMPLGKKHIQNLTNQRAFRLRKENYVKNLEIKASRLEVLYNSAQDEIKSLSNRIALLEKKLASSRLMRNESIKNRDPNTHYGGILNSAVYQAIIDNHTIYDENKDGPCDVIMNDQLPKDSDLFCDPITPPDERIWITSTTPTTYYPPQNTRDNDPTFSSPQDTESQWYFPQQTSTAHHPLNLKWILSDTPNEE